MTTAKKTAANKAATDKAAETKATTTPDAITVDGDKLAAAVAEADQIEHHAAPDNDGKVEVICLREFNDLDEGVRRHIGDRFRATPERAADILAKFAPPLIAVIGGGDE